MYALNAAENKGERRRGRGDISNININQRKKKRGEKKEDV